MDPRALSKVVLFCCVLVAADALAQAPAPGAAGSEGPEAHGSQGAHFTAGLRASFGLPLGLESGYDGHSEYPLSHAARSIIPLQLDAGLFVRPRVYLGAFFQYAPATSVRCGEDMRCSSSDLRLGVTASYHLPLSEGLSPWMGVGVGYEALRKNQEFLPNPEFNHAFYHDGVEFLHVEGGVDFHLSGPAWWGPFMTFTVADFLDEEVPALHSWFITGVRLQMRL